MRLALALLQVSALATMVISAPAAAQDYTSGALTGNVRTEADVPVADARVTIVSTDRGITRNATTSAQGGFRITGLPAGPYDVTIEAAGLAPYRALAVEVRVSATTALNPTMSTSEDIVVTGAAAPTTFQGTTTGINLDVTDTFQNIPVSRTLTDLLLLSPNTSTGDSAFGNLASVGGASVAENAYYLNGLNITNFDNYLGSATIPFEFYKTVEVKAGGFPAEYGRGTGGIINAVSKSGTNDFTAAMHLNWSPNFLTSRGRDLTTCTATGCARTTNRREDRSDSYSAILEAGGPIIRDRLFVYGLAEFRRDDSRTISRSAGVSFESVSADPRLALKVDAFPIDSQHLEFTIFDTRNTRTRNDLTYSEVNGRAVYGTAQSVNEFYTGGVSFVGKYTGRFTDWFTISGAYGRMRDRFSQSGIAGAASEAYFSNNSGTTVAGVLPGGLFTEQTVASISTPYNTEREFFRGDADFVFSLLGDHHVRGGVDVERNTLDKATVRSGGGYLLANGYISQAAYDAGAGGAGFAYQLAAGNQVIVNYFNSGGAFRARNNAYYVQDEWKPVDRLTLNLGLRRDDFGVDRADGQSLVRLRENYQPRIGAVLDLFSDRRGQLFGSYGTYNLPFASNTAFRMSGSEYFIRERFAFGGFDANGLPILGAQIANRADYAGACPFGLTPQSSGLNCNVTGDGSVGATDTLIDANLRATKQTEFILGYRHEVAGWNLGLNYTHRRLDVNAEDVAIDAAVNAYCEANGIAGCEDIWSGFHQYVIVNPGSAVTVNLDGLDGRQVTFTPEQLGYGRARRSFDAVEFSFESPRALSWNLRGSYVWSQTRGNSEGFVQSDFGQGDAGITQDFDQPGFLDGAFGLLPTHRRHRFKLFGGVSASENLYVGTNLQLASPRPLSCFGYHPTDAFANGYGAASRYCGGVLSPRGTAQESDWQGAIDLKFAYSTKLPTGQRLVVRADVFNLLNSQAIAERSEVGDLDIVPGANGLPASYIPNPNYGNAVAYQAPRAVRVGLDISF